MVKRQIQDKEFDKSKKFILRFFVEMVILGSIRLVWSAMSLVMVGIFNKVFKPNH